ncbi:Hypothetical predicted protein [Marmota monax]|uniref:Uncharacterized protein n=1 Tax=Marmota monax TaxID=9995 RepID=A0A5E4A502_MARMO|nr:Hypothetical predicted protein [Marmota monax]
MPLLWLQPVYPQLAQTGAQGSGENWRICGRVVATIPGNRRPVQRGSTRHRAEAVRPWNLESQPPVVSGFQEPGVSPAHRTGHGRQELYYGQSQSLSAVNAGWGRVDKGIQGLRLFCLGDKSPDPHTKKKKKCSRVRWYIPAIPPTQEREAGELQVQGQPGQISKTL